MTILEDKLKHRGGGPITGGKYPCRKCGTHTAQSDRSKNKDYRWCPACGWRSDTNR